MFSGWQSYLWQPFIPLIVSITNMLSLSLLAKCRLRTSNIYLLRNVNKNMIMIKCWLKNLQIILLVGTKLQVIITKMAIQIMERGDVVKGVPVVRPRDNLFWFNRPDLLLFLIHFVLFQVKFNKIHTHLAL